MPHTFLQLTEELLSFNEKMLERFEISKKEGNEPDFFIEVKPFSEEVKKINDQWLEASKSWIKMNDPKHIHLSQLTSAHDYLEQLSIQAFYPTTSRTRFINASKTIEYVLKSILQDSLA